MNTAVIALFVGLGVMGCASHDPTVTVGNGQTLTLTQDVPPADYNNAKAGFDLAEAALARGELNRAELIFRDVINRYAYSSGARDARIRLADIKVQRRQYAVAAQMYDAWARDHASSPRVDEVRRKEQQALHMATGN